jgi:hypothetical protein
MASSSTSKIRVDLQGQRPQVADQDTCHLATKLGACAEPLSQPVAAVMLLTLSTCTLRSGGPSGDLSTLSRRHNRPAMLSLRELLEGVGWGRQCLGGCRWSLEVAAVGPTSVQGTCVLLGWDHATSTSITVGIVWGDGQPVIGNREHGVLLSASLLQAYGCRPSRAHDRPEHSCCCCHCTSRKAVPLLALLHCAMMSPLT